MSIYSIIDIEATGGNARTDRLTEIAIFLHDGYEIVDKFTSLVNPERSIPPYVKRLTGISDNMAREAPLFSEIMDEVLEITRGSYFVAHDSKFDYDFIRTEFISSGYHQFRLPQLCTLQLSKKLLPNEAYYSLGKLCKSLEIPVEGRHRAEGDAYATVQLFEHLLKADKDKTFIPRSVFQCKSHFIKW